MSFYRSRSNYHPRGPAARVANACDQTRLALLCFLLISLPFALGGRADWTLPAVGLVNAVGFALLFLEIGFSGRKLRWHRSWLYALAILALLSLQILPYDQLTTLLSPRAWRVWEEAREAGFTDLTPTLSLAPARTRLGLLMLVHIGLTGWLIYNTFMTRRRLVLLSAMIGAAALANAIAGFVPIVFELPPLFADLDITSRPLSGTFLNRNHFGFLMVLGLIQLAGIAWAIYGAQFRLAAEAEREPRSLESLFERRMGPLLTICGLTAVLVAMGLFLSLSRGATISVTVGLILFAWMATKSGVPGPKREIVIPLVLLAGALVIGGVEALTSLRGRYEALMELGSIGLIGRWNYWGETLQLIRQFPLTGVGLHAFEPASPMVESGLAAGRITFHAHNDYLEILSEVGIPLGVLILGLILVAMIRLWKRAAGCTDRCCRAIAVAAVCALIAGAVHEFVDYSLRAPANGFLVVALAVLAFSASNMERADKPGKGGGKNTSRAVRRRVRKSPAARVRVIGRRVAFTVAAMALTAGALWFYPPRIQAGKNLMELRKIAQTSAEFETTGVARRLETEYCVAKAESILSVMPDNEMAHYYRALYLQKRASDITRQYVGEEITEEEFQKVIDHVLASREAARELITQLPTHGYYQALYAKQLNFSAWFDQEVTSTEIIRAFLTAHARFPNVPQVTRLCIEAFAEILEVDRDRLSASQLELLKKTFIHMGGALLEENPRQARDIYAILNRVLRNPAALIELTPPRLLGYEQLYEKLFRNGDYLNSLRVLERMKEINRTRLTRAEGSEISLYDLARTHPASREEMAARIIRYESAVASVTGNWRKYAALRAEKHQRQRQLGLQRLERARAAAAAAELHQAIRIGRRLRSEYPGDPEVQISLAEWLVTVGNYGEALDALQTLMWLEDVSPDDLRQGLAVAEKMVAFQRVRRSAERVKEILTIRLAVAGKEVDPRRLNLIISRLEGEVSRENPDHIASGSAYDHLAYFYAGRYAEITGNPESAINFYHLALNRCPLHYRTMSRVMRMPADIAGELQAALASELAENRVDFNDLRNNLIDLAPGVKLRNLTIEPCAIRFHDSIAITVAIELTGEVTRIPSLTLYMLGADGLEVRRTVEATNNNWNVPAEQMKVGRIVTLQTELTPAAAAFARGQVLPEGPLHIAVPGGGRDRGFKFYHPGVVLYRER